jgi:hypothetical protein
VNRFSLGLLLRRCLNNWIPVGRSLRRLAKTRANLSLSVLDLQFRNCVNITTAASNALPLIFYYDFAKRVGISPSHDLETLAAVANDIHDKLTRTFSPVEIEECATGGRFNVNAAFLFLTSRKFVPSVVVETGVAQGISSYVILKAH